MDQDDSPLARHRLSTVGEVRRALNPLQEQADRVGSQVEEFAVQLDRLNPLRAGKARDASAALPLIQKYEKIARQTVDRLKRKHDLDRKAYLKRARRDGNFNTGTLSLVQRADGSEEGGYAGTTVIDLIHWEQEQQTWELLGLMLQLHHPADPDVEHTEYEPLQRPAQAPVHRYSSDSAVYENYLATDNLAWEKHVVVQWLLRVADSAEEDVYEVVADNMGLQGDTQALTANGWVRAKENIKQQKRLRSLNRPLGADFETGTFMSSLTPLNAQVTNLDPDASTRQALKLPEDDLATERALWLGCWELMRRGRPWSEILDWCKDRSEVWRAISLRPAPRLHPRDGEASGDLRGRAFWQQTCVKLATSGGVDDYERAVYGLLGGDDSSVFKVCRSWNDHLYAFLSCQLVQRYNYFFCEKFRMPPVLSPDDASKTSRVPVEHFLESLRSKVETEDEAHSPFQALQASIITGRISQYLVEQGWNLSEHLRGLQYGLLGAAIGESADARPGDSTSTLEPDNYDFIRMLAHILIIYATIDPDVIEDPLAENLIVAYVDYLGKAGKQQLLPVYASRLRKDRAAVCMARQLTYIKDSTERKTLLSLMKEYSMEHRVVLLAQIQVIIDNGPGRTSSSGQTPHLSILDRVSNGDIPVIKRNFMGGEPQGWEIDLVDSLEWYLLLDGHWEETFNAGTIVYKHFLRTRSWAAAALLAKRISLSRISRLKTGHILGREVDFTQLLAEIARQNNELSEFGEPGEDSEQDQSKALAAAAQHDELLKSSRIFCDFEFLALALDALSQWEKVLHDGIE